VLPVFHPGQHLRPRWGSALVNAGRCPERRLSAGLMHYRPRGGGADQTDEHRGEEPGGSGLGAGGPGDAGGGWATAVGVAD
jgi:hypothetical protein